ncbi:MAG: methyltransferase domain-containing protein [Candidatus Xenobiia bacterium LiM19]
MKMGWRDETPPDWADPFKEKPKDPQRVLFIHHSGFGDMCFVTPAIKAYKQRYPDVTISVATNPKGAIILTGTPYVSEIMVDKKWLIPYYVEEFDDVINFDGMIAANPQSELTNCYDIVAQWAGIDIPDEDKHPDLYFFPEEERATRKLLNQWHLAGQKYIVMQCDASSKLRSLRHGWCKELAQRLIADGYKIVMCGNKKIECDLEGVITPDPAEIGVRVMALLINFAEFFIGPDSCGLHFAAGLNKPALGIFCSFDGDLRTRYYKNVITLQHHGCTAPCFMHDARCPRCESDGYPKCINGLSVGNVYEVFKILESGGYQSVKTDIFKPTQDIRPCPSCGETERRTFICRKGTVCYYECPCQMIYTDQAVPTHDNPEDYYDFYVMKERYLAGLVGAGRQLHEKCWQERADNRVLDVGCGVAATLDEMRKHGWETLGLEFSAAALKKNATLYPDVKVLQEDFFKHEGQYSLVWLNNVLEHFHEPLKVFQHAWELLEQDGIFAVQVPDGDYWRRECQLKPRWEGVNCSYAGEHSFIPNQKTLIDMASKTSFVFHGLDNPGPNSLWCYFRKVLTEKF